MTRRPRSPNVAVAYLYPAVPGLISHSFAFSLLRLVLHETGRVGTPPHILANECGSGQIVDGRNELVAEFLDKTDASWLLWSDSDMGFAPDALERLLGSADKNLRPVVGGLCFGQRRAGRDDATASLAFRCFPTVYVWRETDDQVGFQVVTDYPRGQLVNVSATGAAFLLIHRRVLVAMREKYGDEWFSRVTHPKGQTRFSEDMSFCIRAQACDVPVWVDTSVKTSHDKGGIFLTEQVWDAQQALVEVEQPHELRVEVGAG